MGFIKRGVGQILPDNTKAAAHVSVDTEDDWTESDQAELEREIDSEDEE